MNSNDFIPPETIRVKCAEKCGDPDFKRHSRGWYMQSIRDGLDLLAFETFFDKGRYDDLTLPDSLILPLPRNTYSVSNIYVFNGDCRPEDSVNVYWKSGFNNAPDGKSYTAPRNEMNSAAADPFMPGMLGFLTSATEVLSSQSAMRFNYDTQFSTPTFPVDNISIIKNSQQIDSGYLANEQAVDLFFTTNHWVKLAAYKYKNYASVDVYSTPFIITSLGNDTNVTITFNAYVNGVGSTTVETGTFLGVKWANIVQSDNGLVLQLSEGCAGNAKVRVEYCGTFGTFEEVPCIPRIIRDAVEDFVCREHGSFLIASGDMQVGREFYSIYNNRLEDPIHGTLWRCQDRVNNLSEWERRSWNVYLSRGNW